MGDSSLVAGGKFLGPLARQVASPHVADRDDGKTTFGEVNAKIKKRFEENQIPNRYLITTRGERGALRYGLDVAP